MPRFTYAFTALVWLYPGKNASWHFVTVPKDITKQIEAQYTKPKRGWGSIPVKVTIGTSTWKTSIFPDKKRGSYLLPLKAAVRKKEDLGPGDKPEVQITL